MDVNNSMALNNVAASTATSVPVKTVSEITSKPTMSLKSSTLGLKEIQDIVRQNKASEVVLSVPEKALATAIEHINKVVSGANIELRHSLHKETNTVIVTLIDKETNDVLLEIPPKKVLDAFVERMTLNGLYLDERG